MDTEGNIHMQYGNETKEEFALRVGVVAENLTPIGKDMPNMPFKGLVDRPILGKLKMGEQARRADGAIVKRVSPLNKRAIRSLENKLKFQTADLQTSN